MRSILILFIALTCSSSWAAEVAGMQERSQLIDRILEQRFTDVLPGLMRREKIDMWVIMSREYNEDPVIKTMLPAAWISARRHTMLVIYDPGAGKPLERLAVARYAVADLFSKAWDKEQEPDQWAALARVISERNPRRIAVNVSESFALADGMSSTEYRKFMEVLPAELRSRVIPAENLAIAWLETRSELEMELYPQLVEIGHELIATAFSNEVVTPGVTTTDDIIWWLRDQSTALGLGNWFHPSVSIQRADDEQFDQVKAFSKRAGENVIQPGDLIHVDFGITYLRLNTDQQQHAYVLNPGETAPPASLQKALVNANRLQDILTGNFEVARSGNEILRRSREQAIAEGLKPSIYTHPLGLHGHGAGPTIGMWDAQDGLPVVGDYPVYPNTVYSIELNAATYIPEWDKEVRIMLEEDAFFDGRTVEYIDGRQKAFHLISSGQVSAPKSKQIALSFDDIPRHAGSFFTPDQRTAELISALDRAGVEQAGFFVTTNNLREPDGVGGEERIRAYVDAGHVIANHSDTHPWLSKSEVDDYLADIDTAEEWLAEQPGHRAWFRYPYLDEGKDDRNKRDAVRGALKQRGLFNAYVTIDNYDWYLDGLASRAKSDQVEMDMDGLRSLYVDTLVQAANFYNALALDTIGRSPAHVLLLHETDLAALYIDDLVEALRKDGWEIITMDQAYADPIALIEPDTLVLGSGRVAALAHTKGTPRSGLVHERTDEKVLNRLFAEQVLVR
jgi:peptidoglycan/xylan/chitin deacetylase (PgdA/CDA1 family)